MKDLDLIDSILEFTKNEDLAHETAEAYAVSLEDSGIVFDTSERSAFIHVFQSGYMLACSRIVKICVERWNP